MGFNSAFKGLRYGPWKNTWKKKNLNFVYYYILHRLPQEGLFINNYYKTFNFKTSYTKEGRDSSVGIANGYGMDGPGIESRGGGVSYVSRSALDPPQSVL